MTAAATRLGIPLDRVADVAVEASVMLIACDDGAFELGAELDVELPSVDDAVKAAELVHLTHEICPYSSSVRGNVHVATAVNGIALEREVGSH